MYLQAHQHELLCLYAQKAPVGSEVFRTSPPPGGESDPEWDHWCYWQGKLNSATFSLYSAGLITVVGKHVPGQADIVAVTEAGYAALADPNLEILDPGTERELDAVLERAASPEQADELPEAWDLLDSVATARGWSCRAQPFGHGLARLLVTEERRWVGLSISPSQLQPLTCLTAGRITPSGRPTRPLVEETVYEMLPLERVLHEVERLWERLNQAPELEE